MMNELNLEHSECELGKWKIMTTALRENIYIFGCKGFLKLLCLHFLQSEKLMIIVYWEDYS